MQQVVTVDASVETVKKHVLEVLSGGDTRYDGGDQRYLMPYVDLFKFLYDNQVVR